MIVIGGGPAGATVAGELAGRGVSVLLLEKAAYPRPKCCGGGLTVRAAGLLGGCVGEVAENTITTLRLSRRGAGARALDLGQPLMYTLSRESFDQLLAERAQQAGARILCGTPVTGVAETGDGVEVVTAAGVWRGRFAVGADGARSVVAKAVGGAGGDYLMALSAEVVPADRVLDEWRSRVALDLGSLSRGYGWLFPKAGRLSIGVGGPARQARRLRDAHHRLVHALGIGDHTVTRWSAAPIPVCRGEAVVSRGRLALVGDAAALADPFTGEGIYNAIVSGRLAARAIISALENKLSNLGEYQRLVDAEIMPEMAAANRFARLLGTVPGQLFGVADRDGRVQRAGAALLRGETTYASLWDRFVSLGGLYSFLLR